MRLQELAATTFTAVVGGATPDAERATALRKQYLNWHEQVEALLTVDDPGAADKLQNARHRDIANGRVPADELYRTIHGEQTLIRQQLQALIDAAAVMDADASSLQRELRGRTGQRYTWNEDDLLGSGTFGRVYRGVNEKGAGVAVKRIDLRGASTAVWVHDARFAERELELHSHLGQHPNIIPMIDDFLDADALWIVMPLAGHSLHEHLKEHGPMSEAEVKDLALDLVAALRHLAKHVCTPPRHQATQRAPS